MWRTCQQCVTFDVVLGGVGAVSAEASSGKAGFQAACLFLSARAVAARPTRGQTLSDRQRRS